MKIISGFLKGKKLKGHDILGTRPTMARVKESLFAMIQNDIKESVCLDLFAGSGNLGIEAISNGAKKVYFVDNNKLAINKIKENVNICQIEDRSIIIKKDYQEALNEFVNKNINFDIIFLDPPYKLEVIIKICAFLSENNLIKENGKIICEHQDFNIPNFIGNLEQIKNKKDSDKFITIYKLK